MDTIFALATAPGRAGVAVVRVSGPAAHDAARRLAGDLPPARQAALRRLRAADGAVLDEALVLVFAAGHSFTGEDVAEFQVHGSPAIVRAVLAALADMPGLRPAEPGEFTRRALENERLDLAQVEGLADLIEAETEAQRKQAYAVFSGALGARAEGWRAALVRAAALIEATIDFVDEDVPVDVFPEVRALLDGVRGELRAEAAGVEAAERLRDGFEVAIIGKPNTGKSTLMNAIAGRDVAITSDIAGTTRDVIELRTDIRGLPVTFLDTAGLRGTEDLVEAIGVARATERAEAADLRIFLREPGEDDLPVRPQPGDLSLGAKGDLNRGAGPSVSGVTGEGIAEMLDEVADVLGARVAKVGTATRQRHRRALNVAFDALLAADEELALGEAARHELVAERLREASRALDQLIGRVDVEDLLDHIFSSFCIGK